MATYQLQYEYTNAKYVHSYLVDMLLMVIM